MDAHHELNTDSAPLQMRSARVGHLVPPEPSPALDSDGYQAAMPRQGRIPSRVYLVWTAQPDGSIDDGALWRAFTGQSLDGAARDGWLGAIHPDERAHARQIWRDALARKAPFAMQCRVRRANRRYGWLLIRGVPMLHDDGTVREWVLTGAGVAAREERDASRTRAYQLEAIVEAMADGALVFDREGRILQMNAAARRLLARDARPDSGATPLAGQMRLLRMRDADGRPLPQERLVSFRDRLLAGEVLIGGDSMDLTVRAPDGHDATLSISGAPVRDARGRIIGAVETLRDVTERRQVAQRTRDALAALVAMAETLVSVDLPTPDGRPASGRTSTRPAFAATTSRVARRLAELTRRVMGGRRLAIVAEAPREDGSRVVAVAGLSPREQRLWCAERSGTGERLVDLLPPTLLARLEHGESIPVDHALPEFAQVPNPLGTRSALLTPMRLGGRLVGFIAVDYGPVAHAFTPDELALAAGAARLAALVLGGERLLREREDARVSASALCEANRRMDEFLAVAAHELRGPVQASLLGVGLAEQGAQRLRDRVPARESELAGQLDEQQRTLAQAEASVERLGRLIEDLLDASRLRAGQLSVRREPADLADVVGEAVARQRLLAPARAIRLHLPATVPVPALADAGRIGQVVANYVDNALKYSPEDRPVEVRLRVRGGRARVSVRDEGSGLPIEEQRRIWERYQQAPGIQANAGSGVGLGLGLYIAREIVKAHRGQVGVRSAPGKGSTFWFTLPLARPD